MLGSGSNEPIGRPVPRRPTGSWLLLARVEGGRDGVSAAPPAPPRTGIGLQLSCALPLSASRTAARDPGGRLGGAFVRDHGARRPDRRAGRGRGVGRGRIARRSERSCPRRVRPLREGAAAQGEGGAGYENDRSRGHGGTSSQSFSSVPYGSDRPHRAVFARNTTGIEKARPSSATSGGGCGTGSERRIIVSAA